MKGMQATSPVGNTDDIDDDDDDDDDNDDDSRFCHLEHWLYIFPP